jgi:hypothetical protein
MYSRVDSHRKRLLIFFARGEACSKMGFLPASLLVWYGLYSSAAPPSQRPILVSAGEFLLGDLAKSPGEGRALIDLQRLASQAAANSFLDMEIQASLQANSRRRELLECKIITNHCHNLVTHTWDIVSLLGAYDEMLPDDFRYSISEWRRSILNYCWRGEPSCGAWHKASSSALLIQKDGMKCLDHTTLTESRAQKLLHLTEQEVGEHGFDFLWENVIRFFLKTGNPRYAHEAADIEAKHVQG